MTISGDSPKGPERIHLDLGGGFGAAASYVGSAFSTKDEWTIEYVRADLYDQCKRELEALHEWASGPNGVNWYIRELEEARRERNLSGEECVRLWEERNRAIRELAEVKRERDELRAWQKHYDRATPDTWKAMKEERDRYLELCEEALSVFDSGPIQFSRDNVEIIAKLRDVVNPPTPKPSDAQQASESDDAVTREEG